MSCSGNSDCLCGCCAGTSVQTPKPETNSPGLPAVSYRAGTWTDFKQSMLARLSSSDYLALAKLKTRTDDDFTVAFLDATAMVLDILTFYQERLVNESYLRTATQLRSLTELSRLISYAPAPGVSASVYLAFTLKKTPGLPPDPSAPAITIPQGTQVQSVPTQGQTPQTFETSADIQAKQDWNALPVLAGVPWQTGTGAISIYLEGTATKLQPGDSLLILGVDRETGGSSSEAWDVVVLNDVQVDALRNLTCVTWDRVLTHLSTNTSTLENAAKIFAFRQKASLFGHNAPDPNLFVNSNSPSTPTFPNLIDSKSSPSNWRWDGFTVRLDGKQVDDEQVCLDAAYPKLVVDSWFVLAGTTSSDDTVQLYEVDGSATVSLSMFTLSGQVTKLTADQTIDTSFDLRSTAVWAQSEELTVANQPLTYPLYGSVIDLADYRPDLNNVTTVALFGKSQKIAVNDGETGLSFSPSDNSTSEPLKPGDILTLADPNNLPLNTQNNQNTPSDWANDSALITFDVLDAAGRAGTVSASPNQFTLVPASSKDPGISEYAQVVQVTTVTNKDGSNPHTQLQLQNSLTNCYDRSATTINANVGLATHGQSVSEILGSGSASTPNQSFALKQSPLTYVQNSTAQNGRQSTLQVQVDSVTWKESPSLYNQRPSAQVFATENQADRTTDVIFGDGVEGALLPTGQNNLRANYRIGSGTAGNVAAGKLTTLMDRPLGVSGVTNPEDASGGQDAECPADIRSNAPQTVLTLGRAVSIADYQNYASTYAGIAKAYAVWISMGPGLGVYLTVAGVNGAGVSDTTISSLISSLQNFGNPLVPISVFSYTKTYFTFLAALQYDSRYDQTAVQANALQAVQNAFSFAARSFGQAVSTDEIATVIQNVPGVIAVNVSGLRLLNSSTVSAGSTLAQKLAFARIALTRTRLFPLSKLAPPPQRLCASLPVANSQSQPSPAEILTLDPNFNAATSFSIMT